MMGYAISLSTNNESARLIEALWDHFSSLDESPGMRNLNYPPHITLAIYNDFSESDLYIAFESITADLDQLPIGFDRLNYFEKSDSICLWAKPIVTVELKKLHNNIHTIIDPKWSQANYRPESWIPHCTLARNIDVSRKKEVNAFVEKSIAPIKIVFDAIDCVSFLPVKIRRQKTLS